jgi:hypothetical protein
MGRLALGAQSWEPRSLSHAVDSARQRRPLHRAPLVGHPAPPPFLHAVGTPWDTRIEAYRGKGGRRRGLCRLVPGMDAGWHDACALGHWLRWARSRAAQSDVGRSTQPAAGRRCHCAVAGTSARGGGWGLLFAVGLPCSKFWCSSSIICPEGRLHWPSPWSWRSAFFGVTPRQGKTNMRSHADAVAVRARPQSPMHRVMAAHTQLDIVTLLAYEGVFGLGGRWRRWC